MAKRSLPKPATEEQLKKAEPKKEWHVRQYIDRHGKAWPWLSDCNPRMWLGSSEDDD